MLSFRENIPLFNSFKKDPKSVLQVVTEEKPRKRKSPTKKSGKRGANTIIKVKSHIKSGGKTYQKIRSDVNTNQGDSASLNSNMKVSMKSPKFLAQLNSRSKRYNKENKADHLNLPRLSKKRICFQKLIENECDSVLGENLGCSPIQDEKKPNIQEIYIFDPDGRRDQDDDLKVFHMEIEKARSKMLNKHSRSVVE